MSLNRNPLPMKCCRWSNALLTSCRTSSILYCTLFNIDNIFFCNLCLSFTFASRPWLNYVAYIRLFLMLFLGQVPKEFEAANAITTFGLTLRECSQERTIRACVSLSIRSEWLRAILPSRKRCLTTNTKKVRFKFYKRPTLGSNMGELNSTGACQVKWVHKLCLKLISQTDTNLNTKRLRMSSACFALSAISIIKAQLHIQTVIFR